MYNLEEFGQMIADKPRIEAYIKAISRAVRPGDVVVDIGCGVGVFALLACRAGARKVYAIEGSEIILWGKQLAAANGFSDRIEFLRADSRQIQLPERANVLVSDVRGSLPLYGEAIESIEDARLRFLIPGGIQIPQVDTLYAAIVESEKTYEEIASPWRQKVNGVDLSCVMPTLLNATYYVKVNPETLLTKAEEWCRLEHSAGPGKRAAAKLRFKARRKGMGHGIALWFDTQLFEEICFSSGPSVADTVYGRFFLPWLKPVQLEEGEEIDVELHADLVGGAYIWRWETKFRGKAGRPESCFRQSTFESAQYSYEALRRRASGYVPSLTELGKAQRWMLQAVDGKSSLEEIARAAMGQFPKVFRNLDEAIRTAAELSENFSS
jgi:protein arginine N-methyltransferase 1